MWHCNEQLECTQTSRKQSTPTPCEVTATRASLSRVLSAERASVLVRRCTFFCLLCED